MAIEIQKLDAALKRLCETKHNILKEMDDVSLFEDNDDIFEAYIKVLIPLGDAIFKLKQTIDALRKIPE